jgi:hypothetical protein
MTRLQEQSKANNDLRDILNVVQNDMLVIVDDRVESTQLTHSTDTSISQNFLGVTQHAMRRRKSSGNIARDLSSGIPS